MEIRRSNRLFRCISNIILFEIVSCRNSKIYISYIRRTFACYRGSCKSGSLYRASFYNSMTWCILRMSSILNFESEWRSNFYNLIKLVYFNTFDITILHYCITATYLLIYFLMGLLPNAMIIKLFYLSPFIFHCWNQFFCSLILSSFSFTFYFIQIKKI